MSEHQITNSDEMVRGHPGTVVRCSCGWASSWGVRDGSAEQDAHAHLMSKQPEYRSDHIERSTAHIEAWRSKGCLCEHFEDGSGYVVNRDCPMHFRPVTVGIPKAAERCHDCSCHISPPCGHCENCRHFDSPDCDNDCQDCEEHNDE